jgi:hypothetical protein
MKTQIILVDWENVQPELLPALNLADVKVIVFVGPHQSKLPTDIVIAMQKLGDRADYIKVGKQGKDALDMHIAFYMGRLATQLQDCYFHIVAVDRDYDPLLAHLKELKIGVAKWPDLSSIPILKRAAAKTPKDQLEAAKDWLLERKANRPKTLKTLTNSLKTSAFSSLLLEEDIGAIIEGLIKLRVIVVQGQKIEYTGVFDA